ncbi:MAG: hypothetical protein QG567_1932 [Campylobacterota bacterium]|nr:hypothetical protein [Campylobacterota bacterium]
MNKHDFDFIVGKYKKIKFMLNYYDIEIILSCLAVIALFVVGYVICD